MEVSLDTPFHHTERFLELIEGKSSLVHTREGREWLDQNYRHLRRIVMMELKVIRKWEPCHCAGFVEPSNQARLIPRWKYPLTCFSSRRLRLNLLLLRNRERIYEQTRQFYVWLRKLLECRDPIRQAIEKDYDDLQSSLDLLKENLVNHRLLKPEFRTGDFPDLLSHLPSGRWSVPVVRSMSILFPREWISSESVIGVLRKAIVENHRRETEQLLGSLNKSIQTVVNNLEAFQAYLAGDTDEKESSSFAEVYNQRSARWIDRFYQEAREQISRSRKRSLANASTAMDTVVQLKQSSWPKVRRKFILRGLKKAAHTVSETNKSQLHQATARGEAWYFQLINEKLKPAMGITHKAKVHAKSLTVDPRWLETPRVPAQLSEVILDRKNPALLVIPPQVLAVITLLKTHYDQNHTGNLLFLTDHMTGSFGMIGYLLTTHFRDRKYKIYRHTITRPLKELPGFDEPIVFLDNFERMLLIDEENLALAMHLVEQVMNSSKLMVISVNQIVAEYIRAAIPAFSRFLFEINLSKYEFSSFKSIIEKRMLISGFQFEYSNEALFWASLYQISSGIPGVGLRIFLRCVTPVDNDRIMLSYNLPNPREYFHSLALKELIILKKILMHPYLEIEAINRADIPRTRMAIHNLHNMGLLISRGTRYSIRPELYGSLRDYLMQINLV
ncbi:MAG: hypothetical protein AB1611_03150 [bacterium]